MTCRIINEKELEIYRQACLTNAISTEIFFDSENRKTILDMEKRRLIRITHRDINLRWVGFYLTEKGLEEAKFWQNYCEL